MDERITYITSQMSQAADDVDSSFGSLTTAQLNWKPGEKSWSVAQCLDHIIKTNREFDAEFAALTSGTRKNSLWENFSPFSGMFGRFLIKTVSEDSKKAKAPSQRIVPPSEVSADIIQRFRTEIEEVNKKVAACGGIDRDRTIVTSPFLKMFTYKFDDALTVLVEHTKRHIRQAKRVMDASGFPK